jgi:hypothetical protein
MYTTAVEPRGFTTMSLTEKRCSVCGKINWDSDFGTYDETHEDKSGKTVKCDTNGETIVSD